MCIVYLLAMIPSLNVKRSRNLRKFESPVATFKVCRDIGQSFSNSLYGLFKYFVKWKCVGKLDQKAAHTSYMVQFLRQCMYLRCHSGHWHVRYVALLQAF